MTECEKLRNDLKAFLDGQLSPASRIALRLHLNRCAACRRELEEMRLLGTNLRAADSLEMSDALRSRILAAVPTTAPEPKVKMLPKWREKPVLIWGASASAVLAWFLLYPAINNYQNRPIIHGENSNRKQVGLALGTYTQDYDETRTQAVDGLPTGTPLARPHTGQRYSVGKHDAVPSWMLRRQPQADGGRATGDTSVIRQTELLTKQDPKQQFISSATPSDKVQPDFKPDEKYIYYDSDRVTLAYNVSDVTDDLPTERQVHKEASLTVEVANAETQSEAVERLVKESKGYVAQNQLTTVDDGTRQAALTCKVPVDQFDTVMGQLARLGLLKGKTLNGEDITDKVSDEQETGHVLRADIATTEEKLKERKRHSDAVRDEETLRQLRIRVAQSQARLKMLTKLGALSEITVELDEKPKNAVPEPTRPSNPLMEEVSGTGQAAAHSFLMALRLPVQLLVWIVVYSPLWALLIYGYRRLTR